MNIKLIKTEADYKDALKRLEVIFDSAIGTPESDEADVSTGFCRLASFSAYLAVNHLATC